MGRAGAASDRSLGFRPCVEASSSSSRPCPAWRRPAAPVPGPHLRGPHIRARTSAGPMAPRAALDLGNPLRAPRRFTRSRARTAYGVSSRPCRRAGHRSCPSARRPPWGFSAAFLSPTPRATRGDTVQTAVRNGPTPSGSACLPTGYGADDFPLLLQDQRFATDGPSEGGPVKDTFRSPPHPRRRDLQPVPGPPPPSGCGCAPLRWPRPPPSGSSCPSWPRRPPPRMSCRRRRWPCSAPATYGSSSAKRSWPGRKPISRSRET